MGPLQKYEQHPVAEVALDLLLGQVQLGEEEEEEEEEVHSVVAASLDRQEQDWLRLGGLSRSLDGDLQAELWPPLLMVQKEQQEEVVVVPSGDPGDQRVVALQLVLLPRFGAAQFVSCSRYQYHCREQTPTSNQ